jgi:cobalamin biosynthetic protein CobC
MPSPRREFPAHGGDLAFASARYGRPAGGWLDLSTGINPVPYPAEAITAADLARLPDRAALDGLLAVARSVYGISSEVALIAVPGSETAIRLLPMTVPTSKVAIVGPTYGSHLRAWREAGRPTVEVASLAAVPADASIVVLANPNNPDGWILAPEALADGGRRLAERGGHLIVDEAFADLFPAMSIAPHLAGIPAIVLRSFGKFFGLAGLRLGFVAGPPAIIARLAGLLGDWPVSSAAIAIGSAALADRAWQETARARLRRDMARLRALLATGGVAVVGGTDLFSLVESGSAAALHAALAGRGIWTRAFADRPDRLRIGLPAESGFERLRRALAELKASSAG